MVTRHDELQATALDVRPLTPTIGAEIRGVDCTQPVGDDVIAEIRRLWLRWSVVFFPDQQCTDSQQMTFAQRFGELSVGHPVEPTLADLPEVQPIDSLKDRTNFWHTDVTFMAQPPTGSMLRAITVPDVGGDTMWCDTRAAYEALAEPLRTFCDGLSAWHYDEYYAAVIANGDANEWDGVKLDRLVPVRHPVVRVHPETQRPNLFVNPKFTVGLHDFPVEQSRSVLALLYEHMTQPQFIVRYRWRPGTIAFWDNRSTMHYGVYDYGDTRRIMHRVILRGDTPTGVSS
jgi:alpha-ketoglutarate-dependent taurine dioxygenase